MTASPPRLPPQNIAAQLLDALHRAVRAHQAGNLGETEALCNFVLAHDRKQFDALNMLAIVHGQRRNYAEAVRFIKRAIKVNPRSAEAYSNLGRLQNEMGERADAVESYTTALALKPDFAMAHSNFAALLIGLGRPHEALSHCDRALTLQPDYADAWNNRGNALSAQDRLGEALASYDRAIALAPEVASGWHGRGNVLARLARHNEALAAYSRSLSIDPFATEVWIGLGNALFALGRNDEAVGAFDRALAIDAKSVRAWRGRGLAAEALRRFGEAYAAYDTVMSIDPGLEYIEGRRLLAKLHLCDWTNLDFEFARLLGHVNGGLRASPPLVLLGVPSSPAEQLACARIHGADLNRFAAAAPLGASYGHDRIRVAYLSADFRDHAVSFLLAGLFEQHDRARFQTIALSFGSDRSSRMGTRLRGAFETFVDVKDKTNAEVADLMRMLEVDIAVDLMGFTNEDRAGLLAGRPAPIQVAYLGYSGTMGVDFIDYMIADRIVIPEDQQPYYSEKIVYLPDCFQANDDKRAIAPNTPPRAEAGLPESGFVFCCFNQNFKILPEIFDTWMRVLEAVEGSVAWIQQGEPVAARNLRAEAVRRGVAPERIVIAPKVATYEDHLARMRLADLLLDTLPYNAHTTASDALWAGLPVVTCIGTTFAARVAASLLHATGLPELVTTSLAEYEALAIKLAREPDLLAALRAKLAAHRTAYPLFNTDRFRRHIEAAYTTMYMRHQRGEPPASFSVAAIDGT